ncbi:MAG: hypothetical protein JO013_02075 [Alphaproteobacteria bacterium]|nr:hypothetical protein [Alphaproteobacteria bacterium]
MQLFLFCWKVSMVVWATIPLALEGWISPVQSGVLAPGKAVVGLLGHWTLISRE